MTTSSIVWEVPGRRLWSPNRIVPRQNGGSTPHLPGYCLRKNYLLTGSNFSLVLSEQQTLAFFSGILISETKTERTIFMVRKIIQIDGEKCNGCGACAAACHEGAIEMVEGKARLMRDDYCDGLGDCLPACPTGAITFVEREAAAYDEAAVKENMRRKQAPAHAGCPGHQMHRFAPKPAAPRHAPEQPSQLGQWPCQIKLVPVNAPYFQNAKLLIAADCTAFAYVSLHQDFMRGKITLIGCPKLDNVDYSEKLTQIIQSNDIQSVTIVRMEVPCCGGLENAAKKAIQASGKFLPWQVVTVSIDGNILD